MGFYCSAFLDLIQQLINRFSFLSTELYKATALELKNKHTKLDEIDVLINFTPDGLFCLQFSSHVDNYSCIFVIWRYIFMFALLDFVH